MPGPLRVLSGRLKVKAPARSGLVLMLRQGHMKRMSRDALDHLHRWIRKEEERPNARSNEVVAKLRELVTLYTAVQTGRVEDPRLVEARELMQSDPSRKWSIAELARKVGMSRADFARKFRRAFETTPRRYLDELRMSRARALLVATEDSLTEVAAAIGFESEFAFNRAFRRHHGVPPGLYRRQLTAGRVVAAASSQWRAAA